MALAYEIYRSYREFVRLYMKNNIFNKCKTFASIQ